MVQSPTFVNLDSKWFRSYSRVVLETNPDLARVYLGLCFGCYQ
jgi:hypothetical protein